MNAIGIKYLYTLTKHSDHIIFFWEMENNLRLIKLFQNEQGTFFNKVKQLITDDLPHLLPTNSYLSSIQSFWQSGSVDYIHFNYRLYSP